MQAVTTRMGMQKTVITVTIVTICVFCWKKRVFGVTVGLFASGVDRQSPFLFWEDFGNAPLSIAATSNRPACTADAVTLTSK